MRRALLTLEVLAYMAFLATCFMLVADFIVSPDYFPAGSLALIPLLAIAGTLHRIRHSRYEPTPEYEVPTPLYWPDS